MGTTLVGKIDKDFFFNELFCYEANLSECLSQWPVVIMISFFFRETASKINKKLVPFGRWNSYTIYKSSSKLESNHQIGVGAQSDNIRFPKHEKIKSHHILQRDTNILITVHVVIYTSCKVCFLKSNNKLGC